MPRDQKGAPFGIGTLVRTLDTNQEFRVSGFIVLGFPITMEQACEMAKIADYSKTPIVRFWHQVEVVHPDQNPWKDHATHTDFCYADVAQRDGLQVPVERSAVRALADIADADKVVWGS